MKKALSFILSALMTAQLALASPAYAVETSESKDNKQTVTESTEVQNTEMAVGAFEYGFGYVGGVGLKITYEDGTEKTIVTEQGVPTVIDTKGQIGNVTVTKVPDGYEMEMPLPTAYSFDNDTEELRIKIKSTNKNTEYIVVESGNYVAKPGEEFVGHFTAKGAEVLDIVSGMANCITVKEWSADSDSEYSVRLKIAEDCPLDPYIGYRVKVTYKVNSTGKIYTTNIYTAVTIGLSGTTTTAYNSSTTTTTTTTTSTTSTVSTTTTTFKGICDEYDFEGYLEPVYRDSIQYVGEEFDYSREYYNLIILTKDGIVQFLNSYSGELSECSECIDIDISNVDMSNIGDYPFTHRTVENKIGTFFIGKNERLGITESGDYRVKMVEHEQTGTVRVRERVTTTTTTTTTTGTVDTNAPFYFNPSYLEFEGINGFLMSFYFTNNAGVDVEFSSSDESVAYLDCDGCSPDHEEDRYSADNPMVTFCGYGETTLTATAKDGTTAKMIIKVSPATTITTTTACTETTTTTTVEYDYPPVVEYDNSPMKIGETRTVKVYGADKSIKGKIRSMDFNPDYLICDYKEGADTFTITAVAPVSYTNVWIYEATCPFSGEVGITILDEQYVSSELAGDANCDGQINMADAVFIMQCIANPDKYTFTEQGRKNADADKSGDITNMDALTIQKFKLRLIDSLT